MSEPTPDPGGEVLARIIEALRSHRVDDCAFTGGVAVGVWARPRQTRDVDVCGVLPPEEVDRLLKLRSDRRRLLQDLADIRAVVDAQAAALDWSYLRTWLPKEDADLLESVATLDDETLARTFLRR